MNKFIFVFVFFIITSTSIAQKKLIPVTQSTLTGITLPAGSKQDNRILMTSAAKMMMEMETKKANVSISNTEVLLLLAESLSGYKKEMLIKALTESGWLVTENQGDKDYSWLQKGNQSLMMYFSTTKREINLYFAVTSGSPSQNNQVTNTNNNQTVPVDNNNTQQKTDTTTTQTNSNEVIQQPTQTVPTPAPSGFAFTTTNFDDGWTSTVQEDWVEVTKGNIKVLLHYPKDGTIFPADPEPLTNAAWNILVAPRYSNLKNYKTAYVEDSKRPYFGMGYATENKTGKSVFIVLFRRGGGWFEVVTTDNNSFTQEFGFNPETIKWGSISEYMGGWVVNNSQGNTIKADPEIFDKLENMIGRNKFAVAATDLYNTGEWKEGFSSNTFYFNYYTGASAGMSTYSSSQWFVFKAGNNYHWELAAANSYGGQIATAKAKGDGTYKSLNNWQLYFTEMEGKPKTFDVYFSAIKGGRVLWMNDAKVPGSGIFTGYKQSK